MCGRVCMRRETCAHEHIQHLCASVQVGVRRLLLRTAGQHSFAQVVRATSLASPQKGGGGGIVVRPRSKQNMCEARVHPRRPGPGSGFVRLYQASRARDRRLPHAAARVRQVAAPSEPPLPRRGGAHAAPRCCRTREHGRYGTAWYPIRRVLGAGHIVSSSP